MSPEAANTIRVLLVIVPGSFVFMTALAVVYYYAKVYAIELRIARKTRSKRRGLLPLHVATIGVSYLIAIGRDMVEAANRAAYHRPIHPPTVAWNFIEFSLGLVALWVLLKFERKRYQDALANVV